MTTPLAPASLPPMPTADELFAAVAEALLQEPGTTAGTGFGSSPGVSVGGKIAAMLVGGRLVVKLPAERCQELIAGGAEPLSMGRRTMREWDLARPRARARVAAARA